MNLRSGTLVIRPEKIGDLIAAMPALRALRASFPDEPLWLLTDDRTAPLVQDWPVLDRVVSVPWKGRYRGERASWPAIRGHFKGAPRFARCAILYNGCPAWNGFALSLGIPRVAQLGFTWPAPLLGHRFVLRRHGREGVHFAEYYLRVARAIGATGGDLSAGLTVLPAEQSAVLARFPDFAAGKRRVIVHPFQLTAASNFTFAGYVALCERLAAEMGEPVFIVGTPEEAATCGTLPSTVRTDLLGRLTMRELMAALSIAGVVVGGSSGVVHIAGALSRPVVGIFCTHHNHHLMWRPLGPRSVCLTPAPGQCKFGADHPCDSPCQWPAFCDLAFGISHERVLTAVRSVMQDDIPNL